MFTKLLHLAVCDTAKYVFPDAQKYKDSNTNLCGSAPPQHPWLSEPVLSLHVTNNILLLTICPF